MDQMKPEYKYLMKRILETMISLLVILFYIKKIT